MSTDVSRPSLRAALGRLQVRLPTPKPHAVTRRGEEAPTLINTARIWANVVRLYRTGLHPAIGLTIRHRGRVVLDRTIGHVEHHPGQAPGAPVTPDTPFNLFSATKILTATLMCALAEDGKLDLDAPVADILPEFARHGKHAIAIRHLLNHTAGIPDVPPGVDPEQFLRTGEMPWEAVWEARLKSPPGHRVAYHPVTSWALAERLVRETTGQSLREAARSRLLDPLGLPDLCYGVSADRVHEVAKHTQTGPVAPPFMARIFTRTIGLPLDRAVKLTNTPEFLTATLPSANGIGTGRAVSAFMQLLLDRGRTPDGTALLKPETVDRMVGDTTPLRVDGTFGLPMRYGLGVMRGGTAFSLFGLNTPGAFGHLGFTNVVVWADPDRDLAVSFLNTGKPMLAPGMVQWYRVLQRLSAEVPRK